MDRMYDLGPSFIDVTWNAGGSSSNLTCDIVATAQSILGLETCMHLTCTGMPKDMVEKALEDAYKAGCKTFLPFVVMLLVILISGQRRRVGSCTPKT